jgi:hypothetical protein
VLAEGVELGLESGQGGGGRLLGEPAFLGLVESLGLALGLGVEQVAILLGDPEGGQQVLEGVTAAAGPGGIDAPLSVKVEAGSPWALLACRNVSTTTCPVTGAWALAASR